MNPDASILIAGVGSGSLGLELMKCLLLEDRFLLYAADSNPNASGLLNQNFTDVLVTNAHNEESYISMILDYMADKNIEFLLPGSEVTNSIISRKQHILRKNNITPLVNSKKVFDICSDKYAYANYLESFGIKVPKSIEVVRKEDINFDIYPCVIKPIRDSGASNMVFIAENLDEAAFFVNYIQQRGSAACLQEYIEGEEFTVGVMSSPTEGVISTVALKRDLSSKLSRMLKYDSRVISSGWSQGDIDTYEEVCKQCERIALSLGSTWALNIQGRMRDGIFYPFEINPRHSGTSYFRAMSGVNEIILGLNSLLGIPNHKVDLKPAVYYRVLEQNFFYKNKQK